MPPRLKEIHTENDDYQYLETLRRNRTRRHQHRAFFVEGVRHINQALAYRWKIESFAFPKDRTLSLWAQEVLATSTAETHYALPFALQAKLSAKKETSELVAIVEMPHDDLARIPHRELPLIVVVDRPNSPGNLGTIIRSCDALGADGLIITGHAVDLYDPETIAATTGSLFALPVIRQPSPKQLLDFFDRLRQDYGDLQRVGTSAKATRSLFEGNFWRPTVFFVGNETEGLSQAYQELADVLLCIPMQGSASSLNVACATTVMLYEARRQRSR